MELAPNQYYHIYNRSNNNELVFKSEENYDYSLEKYLRYFRSDFDTIAYCLMPTHFHFLVMDNSSDTDRLRTNFGTLLSSHTIALNRRHDRHGSLFQKHSKSKLVDTEQYLIAVLTYIHQNPIRSHLVKNLEDWAHSSYLDHAGLRKNTFLKMDAVRDHFSSIKDFRDFSSQLIEEI